MQRDPRAFLWDVRDSVLAIQSFIVGLDADTYATHAMAQAAVERKFEIIGEALNQLSKWSPDIATRIPDLPQVVAFRNQLIHGYASVNVRMVWNVVQVSLAPLLANVQVVLDELGVEESRQ